MDGNANIIEESKPQERSTHQDITGMTPLHRAVISGNKDSVRLMLRKFSETLNDKDRDGRTPLHYAAMIAKSTGDQTMYRFLVQNGADTRIKDSLNRIPGYYKIHGTSNYIVPSAGEIKKKQPRFRSEPRIKAKTQVVTPSQIVEQVVQALQKGSVSVAHDLVEKGYGKFFIGKSTWNEELKSYIKTIPQFMENAEKLHKACRRGDLQTVETLVGENENLLRAMDYEGQLPIHIAIAHRKLPVVKFIIEKYSYTMGMKTMHGVCPIHIAALNKDVNMFRLLVDHGADPRTVDHRGRTAEFYMRKAGKSMNKILNERNRSPSPPPRIQEERAASRQSHKVTGSADKRHKVSTNLIDSEGDRLDELIDYWIKEGDLLRLEHVVIAGQGSRLVGKTSENKQVKDFLNLVPVYMEKITDVHKAIVRGNVDEVKQVLTRKRFALSRDQFGASPLHLAVLYKRADIVAYIMNKFPETMDGPDNDGRTPLHYAAALIGPETCYNMLKNAGGDTNIRDKKGHTPEYYLDHKTDLPMHEILKKYQKEFGEILKAAAEKPKPVISVTAETPKSISQESEESKSAKEDGVREHLRNVVNDKMAPNDAHYVLETMEKPLSKILTEVATVRPKEPIEYIAKALQAMSPTTIQRPMRRVSSSSSETDDSETTEDESSSSSDDSVQDRINNLVFLDHTRMKDDKGETVLHFAAAHSHREGCFYALIRQAETLIPERDVNYRTCRDIALEKQQLENVAAIDRYVIDAFMNRRSEFITYLVHNGYDDIFKATDGNDQDVSKIMRSYQFDDMIALMEQGKKFQKQRDELQMYVRNNYVEGTTPLIHSNKELVAAKNDKGRCSVHIAVLSESIDVLKILIRANKAAINIPDNLGRTPLHYAMAMPSVAEIGQLLVANGALKTTRDVKLRTPSYYFIFKEEIEALQKEEHIHHKRDDGATSTSGRSSGSGTTDSETSSTTGSSASQ